MTEFERIDFENLGTCEAGDCGEDATSITEEGYRWCAEHASAFYAAVAAIQGRAVPLPPLHPSERPR